MLTNPWQHYRSLVQELIENALQKLNINFPVNLLDAPEGKGDFTFTLFDLAKQLKKSPTDVAKIIIENIYISEFLERIEAQGPYLNFHLNKEYLTETTLNSIETLDENYGKFESRNKKVIVEHTSANPTGPLHVGRVRNSIIGDTIARILKFAGYDVITEFYVDDMGKQIVILTWGSINLQIERYNNERDDYFLSRVYQKATQLMESDVQVKNAISEWLYNYEHGDKKLIDEIRTTTDKVLQGILSSLKRLNIEFDKFSYESDYVLKSDRVKDVISKLKKSEVAREENGAYYLDLSSYGLEKENAKFVFMRKDGTSLYGTRDIAYHIEKFQRADIVINILGEDHRVQAKHVSTALKIININKTPETIFYAFVTLPEGKLSTRKGTVIYLDDLIDEALQRAYEEVKKRRPQLTEDKMREIANIVGIGALRYNYIRIQPEKQIVFDWNEALNFEGNSAPFIQYAHTRTHGILRKASNDWRQATVNLRRLKEPEEQELVKTLAQFPDTIIYAAERRVPHILTTYLHKLVERFNTFYRYHSVLQSDKVIERLHLVNATRIVLRNGLNLLGITAPEEM